MTMDEAKEAGRLVEAYEALFEAGSALKNADDEADDCGLSFEEEMSPGGSCGLGPSIPLPVPMLRRILGYATGLVLERLAELGVDVTAP